MYGEKNEKFGGDESRYITLKKTIERAIHFTTQIFKLFYIKIKVI